MTKEFDAYAEEFTDLASFQDGIDDLEQNSEWMENVRSSTSETVRTNTVRTARQEIVWLINGRSTAQY